jgi:hypothetical protein
VDERVRRRIELTASAFLKHRRSNVRERKRDCGSIGTFISSGSFSSLGWVSEGAICCNIFSTSGARFPPPMISLESTGFSTSSSE